MLLLRLGEPLRLVSVVRRAGVGRSFVRLGPHRRKVGPAADRELNGVDEHVPVLDLGDRLGAGDAVAEGAGAGLGAERDRDQGGNGS